MTFDDVIESAWDDHAEHAEDVAARLADSVHLIDSPKHVQAYVRIVTHVYGEHLGRWDDGVDLLQSLADLTSCADNPACVRVVARGVATLRYAGGEKGALDKLARDDRIAALATAACALAGQSRFDEALAAFALALRAAESGLANDSPATRALAVAGNNLAAALEEKSDRSAAEVEGMLVAAKAGLEYWKRAGTWLEEERAWYRLSASELAAGDADAAIASAQQCVDVCNRHDAPALERCFAHVALALAHRAAGDPDAFAGARDKAIAYRDRVAAADRSSCDAEIAKLGSEVTT